MIITKIKKKIQTAVNYSKKDKKTINAFYEKIVKKNIAKLSRLLVVKNRYYLFSLFIDDVKRI